jgi:hypothetical protein
MAITQLQINKNLTSDCLVWLVTSITNLPENIEAQYQFLSSNHHLRIFEDNEKCEEYIRSLSHLDRIIFIISDNFDQTVVHRIHSLQQVSSIYVLQTTQIKNLQWIQQFTKVGYF